MSARSPIVLILAAVMASMLAACASGPQAVTDFDQRFDFSGVETFTILPIDRTELNSIRVSDLQVERVNTALAGELVRKGYRQVEDSANADLWLSWHLVTEERMDVRSYNSMSYYNCWRCGPAVSDVSVREYTEGTFIVDMIDPLRNRSVWRSVIQSRLKNNPNDKASAERRREAARAVFVEFPPQ
jgi:hypothetical protein